MTDLTDSQLLAEYARNQSEAAFSTLVERHVNLVYSAALRYTENHHHAQEITQAVFIVLARKAGSIGSKVVLSGWLYRTARLTASNFIKSEMRRQKREQEAYMQSTEEESTAVWERIGPLLDEAIGGLSAGDHDVLILRFFENKTSDEVAARLNINEASARKRVSRALEKLRKYFAKRGVTVAVPLIASALSANSVQAAPLGVASAASAAVGLETAASTANLATGVLRALTWTKAKMAVVLCVGTLMSGVAVTAVYEYSVSPTRIIGQSKETYASLSSYSDSGKVVVETDTMTNFTTFQTILQRPNQYRIDSMQVTTGTNDQTTAWSQGNGDFFTHKSDPGAPLNCNSMQNTLEMVRAGCSSTSIPETFFHQLMGDILPLPSSDLKIEKNPDEDVNGVLCHVFIYYIDTAKMSAAMKGKDLAFQGKITTTLWIGKKDRFIHKTRQVIETLKMEIPDVESTFKQLTPEARARMEEAIKSLGNTKMTFTQTFQDIVVGKRYNLADFDPKND